MPETRQYIPEISESTIFIYVQKDAEESITKNVLNVLKSFPSNSKQHCIMADTTVMF